MSPRVTSGGSQASQPTVCAQEMEARDFRIPWGQRRRQTKGGAAGLSPPGVRVTLESSDLRKGSPGLCRAVAA